MLTITIVIATGILVSAIKYGLKLESLNTKRDEELATLTNIWLSRPGPVVAE